MRGIEPPSRKERKKTQPEIIILPDRAALARKAASRFVNIAQQTIAARGRFAAALSGGSTPHDLYQLLATPEFSSQIDWLRTHLFWGDERAVPPDHLDSNFRLANEALLSHVPISKENVHRIHSELNPENAAREYDGILRQFFTSTQSKPDDNRAKPPRFDLILLGLGEDAHTASLFPHTTALRETTRWVAANYVEQLNAYRITFTPPIINAAENILFLVAGEDKANAVHLVLHAEYRPEDLPAQLIQPTNGRLVWMLDKAASGKI